MIKYLFIFFCSISLFADTTFKKKFLAAKPGDYAVFHQGQLFSFVHIRSLNKKEILLEEITAPSYQVKDIKDWPSWVRKGAPGSTSWIVCALDLEKNKLTEAYSYTKGVFLQVHDTISFFSTILKMPLAPVPISRRKKIGPPPMEKEDRRALWKPPVIVTDNIATKDRTFAVYESKWPVDKTPLSEKMLTFYFLEEKKFPFPYWIHIAGEHASTFAKVVESGRGFVTPLSYFPKRYPKFLGKLLEEETGYSISLFCPTYYEDFLLFWADETEALHPLAYSVKQTSQERFFLQIKKEDLPNNYLSLHLFPKKDKEAFCTFFK